MMHVRIVSTAAVALVCWTAAIGNSSIAEARYTGTGLACVSGVSELPIRQRRSRSSRIIGYLDSGQCGMNIEAVEGAWTYIRGSDGGRNVQGWVRNRFLQAKNRRSNDDNRNQERNVSSARSCRQFGRVRSRNSGVSIQVRFVNGTRSQRTVMWLDYRGQPKQYRRLSPGESYVQQTFAGHPWMFTDGPGNCKELFVPNRNTRRYVITFNR